MQPKNRTAVPHCLLKHRSNQELLDGARHLTGRHRTITAHLIAHLAEIDARGLHLMESFPTLTKYCVGALGLSEDEAYRRAYAAELARKYPVILDLLLNGSIHLTTLRTIGPCLTAKNHKRVLEAARGMSKTDLEHLVATVRPKPDAPTVLRKLPEPRPEAEDLQPGGDSLFVSGVSVDAAGAGTADAAPVVEAVEDNAKMETSGERLSVRADEASLPVAPPPPAKARMRPLSPERYNLQLTIDRETYDALRELQDLLRHQVPNGDLVRIVKDSVLERRDQVKRQKFGQAKRSRKMREEESWIPPGGRVPVEEQPGEARTHQASDFHPSEKKPNSRHIPVEVRRQVWKRDQGRCAFVSHRGRRCSERQWLEFHHIHAYALGGPSTVENIALFCRKHNAYEGVRVFGKTFTRPGAGDEATRPMTTGDSIRYGANGASTRPGATSP